MGSPRGNIIQSFSRRARAPSPHCHHRASVRRRGSANDHAFRSLLCWSLAGTFCSPALAGTSGSLRPAPCSDMGHASVGPRFVASPFIPEGGRCPFHLRAPGPSSGLSQSGGNYRLNTEVICFEGHSQGVNCDPHESACVPLPRCTRNSADLGASILGKSACLHSRRRSDGHTSGRSARMPPRRATLYFSQLMH